MVSQCASMCMPVCVCLIDPVIHVHVYIGPRSSVGSTSMVPSQPLDVAPNPQLSAVKGALAEGSGRDRKISLPVVSAQPPSEWTIGGTSEYPWERKSVLISEVS